LTAKEATLYVEDTSEERPDRDVVEEEWWQIVTL
jgi:hypothetical protein